jgi:hypothetical protein
MGIEEERKKIKEKNRGHEPNIKQSACFATKGG